MKKRTKRPRKASGNRASRIAGRLLAKCGRLPERWSVIVKVRDLKTLCASVLSQDETKGRR